MKTTCHKATKIFLQIFIPIIIINYSFCLDKKSLIKIKNINSSLRFLDDASEISFDTEEPTEETEGPTTELTTEPTTGPTTGPTPEPIIDTTTSLPINGTNDTNNFNIKKSSSGLSAGAICGIVIPTVAALLGGATAAALCKGGAVVPASFARDLVDTTLENFVVANDLPIQQALPQIQPVQIQPQPLAQPVRPVYPVNQIEPPLVNKAFQPVYNAQQPMQTVPVQQVEMTPVQQVEMVPVEQYVSVQKVEQIVPVQKVEMTPVQQVELHPFEQVVPVQKVEQIVPVQNVEMTPVQQVELHPFEHVVPVQQVQQIVPVQNVEMPPHISPVHQAQGNSSRFGFSVNDII